MNKCLCHIASSTTLCSVTFLDFSLFIRYPAGSLCCFNVQFPDGKSCEHLFTCIFSICSFSVQILCPFFNWVLFYCFFLRVLCRFLYTKLLSDTLLQIFSPTLWLVFFFSLNSVFFFFQDVFILMKSNIYYCNLLWVHFCEKCKVCVLFHIFAYGNEIIPAPFVGKVYCSCFELPLILCKRPVNYICVSLILGSLFSSLDLCVYIFINTT